MSEVQRQNAEQQFADELAQLEAADARQRPPNWRLSPWAVTTYLLGGRLDDGFRTITAPLAEYALPNAP